MLSYSIVFIKKRKSMRSETDSKVPTPVNRRDKNNSTKGEIVSS